MPVPVTPPATSDPAAVKTSSVGITVGTPDIPVSQAVTTRPVKSTLSVAVGADRAGKTAPEAATLAVAAPSLLATVQRRYRMAPS